MPVPVRTVMSPARYVQGKDAITRLGEFVAPIGSRPLVVADDVVRRGERLRGERREVGGGGDGAGVGGGADGGMGSRPDGRGGSAGEVDEERRAEGSARGGEGRREGAHRFVGGREQIGHASTLIRPRMARPGVSASPPGSGKGSGAGSEACGWAVTNRPMC